MSQPIVDIYDVPYVPPVRYPSSDGKPMAETDKHWRQTVLLRYGLEIALRDREDAYVGSDLLIYFVEGEPTKRVSPDVFAVLGVVRGERRVYFLWREGEPPAVVFEVSSKGTADEDLGSKKGLYEYLGVREYFLVDPERAYLDPPLQGFRLGEEGYVRMVGQSLRCDVLGLEVRWHGDYVRLFDAAAGTLVPTPEEAFYQAEAERTRAEAEHTRAEAERTRAEAERTRAEAERTRAERAEEELLRLRAELAKRGGS